MMRRIWNPLVFVSLVGLLVTTLYLQVSSLEHPPVGIRIGELAPNFAGTTLEGENVSLNDFRGQTVLVNDSTDQRKSCPVEASYFVALKNAGAVVCINLNRSESKANFEGQSSFPHPLVLNPDRKTTELHQSIGLPTSWLVDSDGTVRYIHSGPMTTATLNETLDAIREGREPNVFSVLN